MRRNHKNHIGSPWGLSLLSLASIKFTAEISENKITSLDTVVFKGERFIKESILDIKTHYKQTETFQYTHFTSCHPPGVKWGFIKGEELRLLRTNSSKTTFEECLANYKRHLEARRYPKKYLITWNFRDTLISRFWGSHISGQLNFAILRKFCIWLTLISLFWVRHYFFVNFTRHVPGFDQT